ncbi:MAG: WD40 repeat domain-containing protein [archaeon]|nr:WD40 repeat domain-containing protein [archaeon]
MNPLGNLIASASNDETVRLWTNSVGAKSTILKGHTAPVRSVDFSLDSKYILTASNDKIIKIFTLNDKKFHSSFPGHTNWVKCAKFSPDNRLIGSCSDDNTVRLFDISKRNIIYTFTDHIDKVNCCRFSPDGTCIASCSNDRKIKIWDIRSGRLIQHYDAHADKINSISYHPSGNYLISSSEDSTMKIWDLKLGQILYTVHGHEGPIKSVNFSNCGDYFCSGGVDSILMVWKSNIKNMDEEYISLSKVHLSNMISNKDKLIENEKISSLNSEYVGSTAIRKTKLKGPTGLKCKVTVEPGLKQRLLKMPKNANKAPSQIGENIHTNENVNLTQSQNSNCFNKLPDELASTFDKMIQQLDIVVRTMKIMEQRIQTIEGQVTELYQIKKGMNQEFYDGNLPEVHEELNEGEHSNNLDMGMHMDEYKEGFESDNFKVSHNEMGLVEEMKTQGEGNDQNVPVEIFEDVDNHVEEFNAGDNH